MNSLDLHLPKELELPYQLYTGNIQEMLLQLRSGQRRPMYMFDFMKRLGQITSYPDLSQQWKNLCPTLGDAIAWHPYGSVRFIGGGPGLWDSLLKSRLQDGVVELVGNSYESLEGLHIPAFRLLKPDNRNALEKEIFAYFGVSSEGRHIAFPKPKGYPCLTLLAFSNEGKLLGHSRLDDKGSLVGVKGNLWFR
ncbi:MAG TPA: hypothetical protein VJB13_04830 [Candidatus Nanoarchaeia archaeon]|nr:hypothetical protein [Candidatus Nanoarchaeia archaeon]